ncbi:hypothetical protein HMPREF9446_01486 [Bacteroides fluxus YIT 12057]|uniref:Uncharacterized protein n=1 Tax=Bacteroides fluxus YIT 12057 TaxID=763034 RepID=F3PRY3_9BACE|nr:hypothetical protein HMPREF9446_01486 [Bacteroides fluxus YIT 12057]
MHFILRNCAGYLPELRSFFVQMPVVQTDEMRYFSIRPAL